MAVWCAKVCWNLFWGCTGICIGIFACLCLFGLGLLAVMLGLGYPLLGITIGMLGLTLCAVSVTVGCFTLLLCKRKEDRAGTAEKTEAQNEERQGKEEEIAHA